MGARRARDLAPVEWRKHRLRAVHTKNSIRTEGYIIEGQAYGFGSPDDRRQAIEASVRVAMNDCFIVQVSK